MNSPVSIDPHTYPHYLIGFGNYITLEQFPINSPSFTDLHLKDKGDYQVLCGTLRECEFGTGFFWVDMHWTHGKWLKLEVYNLKLAKAYVEDIRFGVNAKWDDINWSSFFTATPESFLKKTIQSDTARGWVKDLVFERADVKMIEHSDGELFQGIISKAYVVIADVKYSDSEDKVIARGTIKNAPCYTEGTSWIIDRPIPDELKSKEVGKNERIIL